MFFIHTLRMMADLSVYFFIAELFVVSQGGSSQFVQFLLLAAIYGLMVVLQDRNFNRLYMLLPAAVLLMPGSRPLAVLPPVIYMLYLITKEHTELSWDRQSELFSISLKFFPLAGISICLLGNTANFIQYCLPIVAVSFATSVFLMRMLRQSPAVYLDHSYQRKNCTVFLLLLFTMWIFSRDFMLALAANALNFIYMRGIYPLLSGFIWLFMFFLRLVMALFSWFRFGEIKFEENHLGGGEFGPSFKDAVIVDDNVAVTETVFTAIAIVILLVCAFYFFRWLALHSGEDSFVSDGIDIIRGKETARQKKERASTTVLQVRRQYRVFLKLYKERGGKIETSSTSEDVMNSSVNVLPDISADLLAEMRQIYINARYAGTATKADLKRMKQINKEFMAKI